MRDIFGDLRGRNDPCWCGSGNKFKKCHLDRASSARVQPASAIKQLEQSFSKKFCSCPDNRRHECSGAIARAHTISKSKSLSLIADRGHVVSLKPDHRTLAFQGDYTEREVGINRASTFTGFCSFHDQKFFQPLDLANEKWSAEQSFLASYRTFCRERFQKICAADALSKARDYDSGFSPNDQLYLQSSLSASARNTEAAIAAGERLKARYDAILFSTNTNEFQYLNLFFPGEPSIAISGGFEPDVDLKGHPLQNLYDFSHDPELVTLNIVPYRSGTLVSLGWLENESGACRILADQLIKSGTLGSFVFVGLTCIENAFIRPSKWRSFGHHDKEFVRRMMRQIERASEANLPTEWDWVVKEFPARPA